MWEKRPQGPFDTPDVPVPSIESRTFRGVDSRPANADPTRPGMVPLIGALFGGLTVLGLFATGMLALGLWPLAVPALGLSCLNMYCLGWLIAEATRRELSSPTDPARSET